jgi:hypothetical protein
MLKQEVRKLSSRYLNGVLMYPGVWLFTWVKAPWGWLLVSITEHEPGAVQ